MVYRYESDEDASLGFPRPGPDRSPAGPDTPPPAGPSPSRFPAPSLPPPARATRRTARYRAVVPAPKPAPAAASPVPPAPVGFAPALTDDGPGRAGASGTTPPADPPRSGPAGRRGPGRGWRVLIGSVAVLVLLALGGWAAAALLEERSGTPRTAPAPQPGAAQSTAGDGTGLDSRDVDGLPLTAKEVFPGPQLMVDDGAPAYQVLRTQSSGACAVAASGEIADLLDRLGCDQVVRATLRSPDGQHLLTAGLFNLTDLAGAERAGTASGNCSRSGRAGSAGWRPGRTPRSWGAPPPGWAGRYAATTSPTAWSPAPTGRRSAPTTPPRARSSTT